MNKKRVIEKITEITCGNRSFDLRKCETGLNKMAKSKESKMGIMMSLPMKNIEKMAIKLIKVKGSFI